MKDSIIEKMDNPVIAMWKDESVAIYNKGLYELMYDAPDHKSIDAAEVLSHFKVFTEDFEREFAREDYPMTQLCRTRESFRKQRVGVLDSKSKRRILEINGECVFDEKTGEYQAGLCVLTDVTWYTTFIKAQSDQNEQQFQLLCETLPQMVCLPGFCMKNRGMFN